MDGLLLVNKPQGFTSHDIVVFVRKWTGLQRVGHFGTLDPLASGLLLVAVGQATRFFPFFSEENKSYKGKIRLGFSTDTYDSLGAPTSPLTQEFPGQEEILRIARDFRGEREQLPPPYSAKKYRGRPLYKLARKKKKIPLKPAKIFIYSLEILSYSPPYVDFEVKCSSGTYIRSLAHEMGKKLGCGGHLIELVRTEVGNFHLRDSLTLEEIKKVLENGEGEKILIPLERLLSKYPKVYLKESSLSIVINGRRISVEDVLKIDATSFPSPESGQEKEFLFRLFSPEEKLIALARKGPKKGFLSPFLVLERKKA